MLTIGAFARLGQVSPRMLRHYDETGLLVPAVVDARTGYRFYDVGQLARLHRLLALRDLGFGLDQIGALLRDEVSTEELRGMLRLRQAEQSQQVADEQARLLRVEAHLRSLERSTAMSTLDVVVKTTDPVRVLAESAVAAGFGHDNMSPVFERVVPAVLARLDGAQPGIMIAWYEEPADDGSVVVHAGFDVGSQRVAGAVDLPPIRVASVLHRGGMEDIESVYEELVRCVADGGYEQTGYSRELYHRWDDESKVTELQLPIR
jgi:DNA-binding transcriptional MerR regulator/effector-binding domain-containing protein